MNQDYCELSVKDPEPLSKEAAIAESSQIDTRLESGQHLSKGVGVSIGQSYQNPFEKSADFAKALTSSTKTGKTVQIAGAVDAEKLGYTKRKWRIFIDPKVKLSIEEGREEWNKWLKLHNNTSNKKVWEVYDFLAADLTKEVLNEMMGTIDKDLDAYCEKVIIDEF